MKPINFREQDFKREVEKQPYSQQIREEFFDYWSEPDRAQSPKMRFEKEKTWDLSRRMARWARNNNQGKMSDQKHSVKKIASNDFEKIDELLNRYVTSPTSIPFEEFGKWYELMREHKLLKPFTIEEVMSLQTVYNGDNKKCRCAAVQKTFDAYANSGKNITDIIKIRNKLNKTV